MRARLWGAFACAFFLLPVVALVWIGAAGEGPDWAHLARFVLPATLADTALLLAGVALVTAIVGTGTAWLVAATEFPGRAWLAAALVLPLTIPTYIAAYVWVEMLDFAGPVGRALRELGTDWRPEPRSTLGAVLILSSVLYPYVYLTVRVVFALAGASALEVARTLGAGAGTALRTVALPLARPAIAAGVTLALLETLNDIGAVETLGVRTITWTIYETWLNRGSLAGAGQLALALLVVVLLLAWIERRSRRGTARASRDRPMARIRLSGGRAALAFLACALPFALGFLAPVALMARYALARLDDVAEPALRAAASGSLRVALAVTVLAVVVVAVTQAARRFSGSRLLALADRTATIGYALPGTVLAIGVLVPLAAFDNALDAALRPYGWGTGLLLTGSLAALVYAIAVRFSAIGHGALAAGFAAISPNVDRAARTLGASPREIVAGVHLGLMRPALATAALLVFVDAMKELPATLLLRPFGLETLATLIYTRGSQGDFENAALAALLVVALGLVPLAVASRLATGAAVRRTAFRRAPAGRGTGRAPPGSPAPRGS